MNALILLALAAGGPAEDEAERARAAVAVELARLSLKGEPAPAAIAPQTTPEPAVIPGYRPLRFDGVQWIYEREVSRPAAPFAPGSASTPATTAPSAGVPSTSFPDPAPFRVLTPTPARPATPGGISSDCPPGQP